MVYLTGLRNIGDTGTFTGSLTKEGKISYVRREIEEVVRTLRKQILFCFVLF